MTGIPPFLDRYVGYITPKTSNFALQVTSIKCWVIWHPCSRYVTVLQFVVHGLSIPGVPKSIEDFQSQNLQELDVKISWHILTWKKMLDTLETYQKMRRAFHRNRYFGWNFGRHSLAVGCLVTPKPSVCGLFCCKSMQSSAGFICKYIGF